MIEAPSNHDLYVRHHKLRGLFIEHPDAQLIFDEVDDLLAEYRVAQDFGDILETGGLVILGHSGTGKTDGTKFALSQSGLDLTVVGDNPRPVIIVKLSADATLKGLYLDVLRAFGWTKPSKGESAQSLWVHIANYIRDLKTVVIVLDEIQHVRAAGPSDRAKLQDFLKSLVQQSDNAIIPILVGMPSFQEVLVSDTQFRRRYKQIHMRRLNPAIDQRTAIRTLARFVTAADLSMDKTVKSRDFAARLLHASNYAFGHLCVFCRTATKKALLSRSHEVTIAHFEVAYRSATGCPPAVNPFVALDFQSIPIGDDPIDP